ncbi:hypothetical protein T484DRAFT_1640778, partial [Baffinella frigidus]
SPNRASPCKPGSSTSSPPPSSPASPPPSPRRVAWRPRSRSSRRTARPTRSAPTSSSSCRATGCTGRRGRARPLAKPRCVRSRCPWVRRGDASRVSPTGGTGGRPGSPREMGRWRWW